MPPAVFTHKLSAPPLFDAQNADDLAKDDQRRMALLGQCVVKNNAKADFIAGIK